MARDMKVVWGKKFVVRFSVCALMENRANDYVTSLWPRKMGGIPL